jgi:hypothetical protein
MINPSDRDAVLELRLTGAPSALSRPSSPVVVTVRADHDPSAAGHPIRSLKLDRDSEVTLPIRIIRSRSDCCSHDQQIASQSDHERLGSQTKSSQQSPSQRQKTIAAVIDHMHGPALTTMHHPCALIRLLFPLKIAFSFLNLSVQLKSSLCLG